MLIICLVKAFLWNIFSELGSFECNHRMKHLLNLRALSLQLVGYNTYRDVSSSYFLYNQFRNKGW